MDEYLRIFRRRSLQRVRFSPQSRDVAAGGEVADAHFCRVGQGSRDLDLPVSSSLFSASRSVQAGVPGLVGESAAGSGKHRRHPGGGEANLADSPARQLLAPALLFCSSQFLITSMTGYSMPAHLCFNLLWLVLFSVRIGSGCCWRRALGSSRWDCINRTCICCLPSPSASVSCWNGDGAGPPTTPACTQERSRSAGSGGSGPDLMLLAHRRLYLLFRFTAGVDPADEPGAKRFLAEPFRPLLLWLALRTWRSVPTLVKDCGLRLRHHLRLLSFLQQRPRPRLGVSILPPSARQSAPGGRGRMA
jgi:hypothetical protein